MELLDELLEENTQLMKVILKCQNTGRIMDAMVYQTRLQKNIVQLMELADNNIHPSYGSRQSIEVVKSADSKMLVNVFAKFVYYTSLHGFENLKQTSEFVGIPLDSTRELGIMYIEYLREKGRYKQAKELESLLEQ